METKMANYTWSQQNSQKNIFTFKNFPWLNTNHFNLHPDLAKSPLSHLTVATRCSISMDGQSQYFCSIG